MKITRIGLDLAKSDFQVHGVDGHERKTRGSGLTFDISSPTFRPFHRPAYSGVTYAKTGQGSS
jgi:hypothetical protein